MSDLTAQSVIAKLRQRQTPGRDALAWFAQGLADGTVSDAQAGAFAMAVCLNGLGDVGRVALTMAMRDSGTVLSWSLAGPVLDKHSTGGVGDCVSLVLAPALAACGAFVPMISGRGLGHTGGTLDKLESIPGLSTQHTAEQFRKIVTKTGCAIVGASADVAPADKRLYAVRDVTSTVESMDLITASILSKKLAAGLDGLVLDVKMGFWGLYEGPQISSGTGRGVDQNSQRRRMPHDGRDQRHEPAFGAVPWQCVGSGRSHAHPDGDPEKGRWSTFVPLWAGSFWPTQSSQMTCNQGQKPLSGPFVTVRAAERFGQMVAAMGGPLQFTRKLGTFPARGDGDP